MENLGNGVTLVYDWADRLVQVKVSNVVKQESFYDAQNRRVKLNDYTSGTLGATEYIYTNSQVIEEYKDSVLDKTFVYAEYVDDPIVMTKGIHRYYYIKDRQFNVKAMADETGSIAESYEYSAYGLMTIYNGPGTDITATGSAIDNPYGYTGRRWDSFTDLWYYRNRMYSPSLGRFMQKDPAGYVDGLNLYAYVLNNPLMYLDPTGLTSMTYDLDYGGSVNTTHESIATNNFNPSSYNTNHTISAHSASDFTPKVSTEINCQPSHTNAFLNESRVNNSMNQSDLSSSLKLQLNLSAHLPSGKPYIAFGGERQLFSIEKKTGGLSFNGPSKYSDLEESFGSYIDVGANIKITNISGTNGKQKGLSVSYAPEEIRKYFDVKVTFRKEFDTNRSIYNPARYIDEFGIGGDIGLALPWAIDKPIEKPQFVPYDPKDFTSSFEFQQKVDQLYNETFSGNGATGGEPYINMKQMYAK